MITSVLFMALFSTIYWYLKCKIRVWRGGKVDRWNSMISSIICCFTIFFEPEGRRAEIGLYLVPRALEAFWQQNVLAGRVKSIKYGEELVFSLSMAILMYCY